MIPESFDLIVLAILYPVLALIALQGYRDSKLMDECEELERRIEQLRPRPDRWARMVRMLRDTTTDTCK